MHPTALSEFLTRVELTLDDITIKDHLYIWGRNPELSVAEFMARSRVDGVIPHFQDLNVKGAIVKSKSPISIGKCGAILKQAEIIDRVSLDIEPDKLFSIIFDFLNSEYMEDKAYWGISKYGSGYDIGQLEDESFDFSERLLDAAKKSLKKMKVRKTQILHEYNKEALSPRKLQRRKVLESGFEIITWFQLTDPAQVVIGFTRQIIDIDGFAKRDADRPHKRPLLLLGLALARTMVNLVSVQENRHILPVYDPFCGMGSIPAEAYMIGVPAYGSDIDPECVTQTQENLTWLSSRRQYRQSSGKFPRNHIFEMDITQPNLEIVDEFIKSFSGSIVAETNLLTPLKTYPSQSQAFLMLDEFERNYHNYLRGITQILPTGGVGVMVFPQIHTDINTREKLNVELMLKNYRCKILAVTINNASFPAMFVHNWKNPIIERLIVVFQKK
ncbi:MAG: TRM11 family SAM-dependent methyltransferase [Promethearchaeota archaeon]